LAHAAARVCACSHRHNARRHRGSTTTAASTWHSSGVPRVFNRAIGAVFIGAAHGELVAIELADVDHTSGFELRDHGGIKGRLVARKHIAARRRGPALGDKNVFVRQRNAQQRGGVSLCNQGIGGGGLRQRVLGLDVEKGVITFARSVVLRGG
jgi:hypothetical protein